MFRSTSTVSGALRRRRVIRHLRATLPSGVSTRPHAAARRRVIEPRDLVSPRHPPSIKASWPLIDGGPPTSMPPKPADLRPGRRRRALINKTAFPPSPPGSDIVANVFGV